MIYLMEENELVSATPQHMERFIALSTERLIPLIETCGGRLMSAWICNAQTLFQITQIIAFENFGSFSTYRRSGEDGQEGEAVMRELDAIAPFRKSQLYIAAGPALSEAFEQAIVQSRQSGNRGKYTIAVLDVVHDRLAGLAHRNESAVKAGMPLVTTLKSLTGQANRVINIWKGDFNEPGYQPPEFYESIGFGQQWWSWIRETAPRERLLTVSMLPYSPLQ